MIVIKIGTQRDEMEVSFAKVILDNINQPARHMLISVHSPGVTRNCAEMSPLPLPALRLLGLCL